MLQPPYVTMFLSNGDLERLQVYSENSERLSFVIILFHNRRKRKLRHDVVGFVIINETLNPQLILLTRQTMAYLTV
jgi:hypothetical protein